MSACQLDCLVQLTELESCALCKLSNPCKEPRRDFLPPAVDPLLDTLADSLLYCSLYCCATLAVLGWNGDSEERALR